MEVVIRRDGALRSVDRLDVSGWMPDHNHGLVQIPKVRQVGVGHYRVEGLLLHMRGAWQLRMALIDDGQLETARFDLEL